MQRRYLVLAGLAFLSQGCGHLSSRDARIGFAIIELGLAAGQVIAESSPEERREVEYVAVPVAVPAPPLPPAPPALPAEDSRAFNRQAAASAFAVAASFARDCRSEGGPTGEGRVSAIVETSGTLSVVIVSDDFANTRTGECVVEKFRHVRLAPFEGAPQTVSKSFVVPR